MIITAIPLIHRCLISLNAFGGWWDSLYDPSMCVLNPNQIEVAT